jgi:hypothetical protein
MLSLKIVSLLLGLLLLVPLAWVFGSMAVRTEKMEEDAARALEFGKKEMEKEFSEHAYSTAIYMATKVETRLAPFEHLEKFIGFYPRRWVGICGLLLSVSLLSLWVFSVLVPARTFEAYIHREEALDIAVPENRGSLIFMDEARGKPEEKQD